ncbi:MAG: HAMP domain-containing protein [Bacteroidetes bacterium]|nr:HAMP domain-containing protein [Bacteroidota bacterium]
MKNLSITLKVIIYVSILGFSCIFAMGYVSINAADKILTKNAHEHLMSVQSMKKQQVEDFIQSKINAVEALAKMPVTIMSVNALINYSKNEGIQNKDFLSDVNIYSNSFLSYMNANNMDNIIIAESKNGKVIYSAMSGRGFETDLSQQSNMISKVWRSCLRSDIAIISDMESNGNKNEKPSLFIGCNIIDNGEVIAVVIAEINSNEINNIVVSNNTMGESGETYIVGDDYLFRTDSKFTDKSTTLSQTSKTKASERALSGQQGSDIITDYRGIEVLSSYEKLNIKGLNWAIITEIDENEIMKPKSNLINTILIICAIIAIIMMPVLYFIGQSLSRPLKKEVEYAKKLANGELDATIDINQKDEIGVLADALRTIAQSTKRVITSVINATNNLADASFQLSASSQNLSSGASEQASSIEEVSASMEEMTSNIQQNSDNANQTEEITNAVSTQVSEGSNIVLSSVESMEKIADKISIISDIAFQTNILALNASVEAARAGEYGKGFGVVASEVGKLADKTKLAALEINEISKASVAIAGKTKDLMGKLVPSIQNSSMLVQEISAASKEQRDAADQINNAIQILNDVSQQNAASAEEMATNSEELSSQAEQLVSVISHFKISGLNENRRKKSSRSTKLITERKVNYPYHNNVDDNTGVDIDLHAPDNMDDDFERF